MIELATKTITAESRMGNHNAVMETIVPPSLLSLHGRAAEDPPKPMPDGMRSQPVNPQQRLLRLCFSFESFFRPKGTFRNCGIRIVRGALSDRKKAPIATVPDSDQGVSAQAVALGAFDWRAPKFFAEFFIADFCQPR